MLYNLLFAAIYLQGSLSSSDFLGDDFLVVDFLGVDFLGVDFLEGVFGGMVPNLKRNIV